MGSLGQHLVLPPWGANPRFLSSAPASAPHLTVMAARGQEEVTYCVSTLRGTDSIGNPGLEQVSLPPNGQSAVRSRPLPMCSRGPQLGVTVGWGGGDRWQEGEGWRDYKRRVHVLPGGWGVAWGPFSSSWLLGY